MLRLFMSETFDMDKNVDVLYLLLLLFSDSAELRCSLVTC